MLKKPDFRSTCCLSPSRSQARVDNNRDGFLNDIEIYTQRAIFAPSYEYKTTPGVTRSSHWRLYR